MAMNPTRSQTKSAGGVDTGGSLNSKRSFTLMGPLAVFDISGILENRIHTIRQFCACVFMNSTVKGI
jgi:hypothetical protein